MNIFKKIISAGMTIIAAGCIVTGSLSAGSVSDAPETAITAEAATKLKDAVFPVNNGCKVAFVYGYSKEYGTKFHKGIDIHAVNDTTVYCAVSGTVDVTNNSCSHLNSYKKGEPDYHKCNHGETFGNSVYIKGDDGLYYKYGHLKKNSIIVKPGQRVEAGQALATIGSSGFSTGEHLHFQVNKTSSSSSATINVNKGAEYNYKNGPYFKKENVYTTATIVSGKIYNISPAANMGTGIAASGTADKANAALAKYNKTDKAQQWVAEKDKSGYFRFRNVKSGKYLDCAVNSVNAAANSKNVWTYSKQTNQQTSQTQLFKAALKSAGKSSYYAITLYNTKYSLDAATDSPAAGSNIQIYQLTSGTSNLTQQWVFRQV
jgi:murein DD-endopeptidase MepM/ murein hydrolase activator NlpD